MGGGPSRPDPPPPIAPPAIPVPGREIDEAKAKVSGRAGTGRQQNILAGRMMSQRGGNLLNTRLG